MISLRLLIFTYLCVGGITWKTQGIAVQTEDLVDEYYTTIVKPNDDTISQDDTDADAILKSDRKEEVIAGILPYRDKIRRFAINHQVLTKINPEILDHNRDSIEAGEPNHNNVMNDAKALKDEHDSGHWHKKKRDQLELILMYKSIKYARAVLTEFEAIMNNKTESIINDCIQNDTKLNHDLADAYSSLAKYIKDKYSYIAEILRNYCDGSDRWAAWIMCIAVLHPNEWSKVDLAFQKDHTDGSLTEFIKKKLTTDEIMAEMIAVIIDPNFTPSKFSGNSVQGGQGGGLPKSAPAPPPVPPTVPAKAPSPAS